MSDKQYSSMVASTWHHSSTPSLIDTAPPCSKDLSASLNNNLLTKACESSWFEDWNNLLSGSYSSDYLGQSETSSGSMCDVLDSKSTRKLSEQYSILDSALYGDSFDEEKLTNKNLLLECRQWKNSFPHFRAVGVGIKLQPRPEDFPLEEEGTEEVIASDGVFDEQTAVQSANDKLEESQPLDFDLTEEDINNFKEKVKKNVVEKIFSKIWPNVVKNIDPVFTNVKECNKLSDKQLCDKVNKNCVLETDSKSELPKYNNTIRLNEDISTLTSDLKLGVPNEDSLSSHSISSNMPPQISSLKASTPVPKENPSHDRSPTAEGSTSNTKNPRQPTLLRHSSTKSTCKSRLGQPAPVVVMSAEKLINPILKEAKYVSESALLKPSKKVSGKITSPSRNINRSQTNFIVENKRICSSLERRKKESICKRSSYMSSWNRHSMLPPISSKENFKCHSTSVRPTSAFLLLGKSNKDTRPNTSLQNKRTITLLPVEEEPEKINETNIMDSFNSQRRSSKYLTTDKSGILSRRKDHQMNFKK